MTIQKLNKEAKTLLKNAGIVYKKGHWVIPCNHSVNGRDKDYYLGRSAEEALAKIAQDLFFDKLFDLMSDARELFKKHNIIPWLQEYGKFDYYYHGNVIGRAEAIRENASPEDWYPGCWAERILEWE